MQSDEDGDEASKKRSFKKIANTDPDLLHLIADLGHHREVCCTVRFSNSDINGPEVFEAAVNNDDLKPPARRTVLPPPPCLRLMMQRRRRRRRRRRSFRSIIWSIIQTMRRRRACVIGHGIGGKHIPIMACLAKARRWSKR